MEHAQKGSHGMSKVSQGTVLFLSGLVLLTVVFFDIHTRYVRDKFSIMLVVAGVLLVVLAGLTLRQSSLEEKAAESGQAAPVGDHECADHSHSPKIGWLLLVPITVMALVVPPALGADAALRQDDSLRATGSLTEDLFPPLPKDQVNELDLGSFVSYTIFRDGAHVAGRPVKLLGFVTPAEDGTWYITRMVMGCCAGDAFAVKIRVTNMPPPPTDSWVEVTGVWVPPGEGGSQETESDGKEGDDRTIPHIEAHKLEPAQAPDPEYL